MTERWTTAEAAAHCGIKPGTFSSYVSRKTAPQPVGQLPIGGGRAINLFDPDEIRAWKTSRPGRGWHGSHDRT